MQFWIIDLGLYRPLDLGLYRPLDVVLIITVHNRLPQRLDSVPTLKILWRHPSIVEQFSVYSLALLRDTSNRIQWRWTRRPRLRPRTVTEKRTIIHKATMRGRWPPYCLLFQPLKAGKVNIMAATRRCFSVGRLLSLVESSQVQIKSCEDRSVQAHLLSHRSRYKNKTAAINDNFCIAGV